MIVFYRLFNQKKIIIMDVQRKIELLQKVYSLVNNKTSLNNLQCAMVRDCVNMVIDALVDEQFAIANKNE